MKSQQNFNVLPHLYEMARSARHLQWRYNESPNASEKKNECEKESERTRTPEERRIHFRAQQDAIVTMMKFISRRTNNAKVTHEKSGWPKHNRNSYAFV